MDWQTAGVWTAKRSGSERRIRETRESAKTRGRASGESGPRQSSSSTARYDSRSPRSRNTRNTNRAIADSN